MSMSDLPLFAVVNCPLSTEPAVEVDHAVSCQMDRLLENKDIESGQSVAVAVGSRGIANLPDVVAVIVQKLKQRGLKPFLIPAMGSHGGATSQGQKNVLKSIGISADELGVEIRAEMETEKLGRTSDQVSVHFSRVARSADYLLLCNRVKPHTNFSGSIQSGLRKMLTVGLGKATGAAAYHQASHSIPFDKLISESVNIIGNHVSLLGGVALLENARKELCHIEAVPFSLWTQREPELLQQAEALIPRLPVKKIDLLIVDEIGKEISGTGLDTNVVGRKYNDHLSTERDWCQTRFIHVRGLTKKTAGNATGIGIAEFCTRATIEQIDWPATIVNAITAGHPTSAMSPVAFQTDREVFEAVFKMIGEQARIVQIKNTLQPDRLLASQSCLDEIKKNISGVQISPLSSLEFNTQGNLRDISAIFS